MGLLLITLLLISLVMGGVCSIAILNLVPRKRSQARPKSEEAITKELIIALSGIGVLILVFLFGPDIPSSPTNSGEFSIDTFKNHALISFLVGFAPGLGR